MADGFKGSTDEFLKFPIKVLYENLQKKFTENSSKPIISSATPLNGKSGYILYTIVRFLA